MQMSKVQWLFLLYLKNTWLTKESIFNKWYGTNGHSQAKKKKQKKKPKKNLGTDLITLKKFNLKWIKDLVAKHKIVKLLDNNAN